MVKVNWPMFSSLWSSQPGPESLACQWTHFTLELSRQIFFVMSMMLSPLMAQQPSQISSWRWKNSVWMLSQWLLTKVLSHRFENSTTLAHSHPAPNRYFSSFSQCNRQIFCSRRSWNFSFAIWTKWNSGPKIVESFSGDYSKMEEGVLRERRKLSDQ